MASLARALCCRAVRFIPAIVVAFPAICQQRDSTSLSQEAPQASTNTWLGHCVARINNVELSQYS
jgi:hypothetical protein